MMKNCHDMMKLVLASNIELQDLLSQKKRTAENASLDNNSISTKAMSEARKKAKKQATTGEKRPSKKVTVVALQKLVRVLGSSTTDSVVIFHVPRQRNQRYHHVTFVVLAFLSFLTYSLALLFFCVDNKENKVSPQEWQDARR